MVSVPDCADDVERVRLDNEREARAVGRRADGLWRPDTERDHPFSLVKLYQVPPPAFWHASEREPSDDHQWREFVRESKYDSVERPCADRVRDRARGRNEERVVMHDSSIAVVAAAGETRTCGARPTRGG